MLDYQPPIESRLGAAELRARFPLELISSKSHDSMNSTFGNEQLGAEPDVHVFLHDDDARARGIGNGDPSASSTSAAVVRWWPV